MSQRLNVPPIILAVFDLVPSSVGNRSWMRGHSSVKILSHICAPTRLGSCHRRRFSSSAAAVAQRCFCCRCRAVVDTHANHVLFSSCRLLFDSKVQIYGVRPKQATQERREEGVRKVQVQVQVQAEEVTPLRVVLFVIPDGLRSFTK